MDFSFFRKNPWVGVMAIVLGYTGWLLLGLTSPPYTLDTRVALVPVFVLVGAVAIFRWNWFVWGMVLVIPLSLNLSDVGGGFGVSLPVEPMVALVGAVFLFRWFHQPLIGQRELTHPLVFFMALTLFWVITTGFQSTFPEASIKLMASRMGYILVFFFFFLVEFRDKRAIKRFMWLYLLGFTPVILYSLNNLAQHGFARAYTPAMSAPFYSDHTIFGAALAMIFPFFWILLRNRASMVSPSRLRNLLGFLVPLVAFALVFSFSRAAWLSTLGAAGFAVLLHWRVPFAWVATLLVSFALIFAVYGESFLQGLKQNQRDHVENEFLEHAATIGDVDRDESNKERLNRWSCAFRMFQERPLWGWGPGTFEFNYAGFQVSSETTRISTFDADRGDAHSEYMTALSEQGLIGFVLLVGFFLSILYSGMKAVYQAKDPETKKLATGVVLGFVTYFIHGLVNSFLDIDKAASLFWAMAAMLVALDIYHNQGLIPEKSLNSTSQPTP